MSNFKQRTGHLVPETKRADSTFALSLAVSADGLVMAVGDPWLNGTALQQGGVDIYDIVSGVPTYRASVTVPSATVDSSDSFGRAVALNHDGSVLAVGCPDYSGSQGIVRIFDVSGSTLTERFTIEAADAAPGELFGLAIGLSSNASVLMVSAPGNGGNLGKVYVYDIVLSSATERFTVLPSSTTINLSFGWSLAIDAAGNTMAVGSLGASLLVNETFYVIGSVTLYTVSAFAPTQVVELFNPSGVAGVDQGYACALAMDATGNKLVVGARSFSDVNLQQGKVVTYRLNESLGEWRLIAHIALASPAEGDYFGQSLAASPDMGIIYAGAYLFGDTVAGSGGVFTLDIAKIPINIIKTALAVTLEITVNSAVTGQPAAAPFFTTATGAVLLQSDTLDPVLVTVGAYQGNIWQPLTSYLANDLVLPANPATTPFYYKYGSNCTSSATEPTWVTTPGSTCDDGGITGVLECIEQVVQPITNGPLLPEF